jgi:hypothetical protein
MRAAAKSHPATQLKLFHPASRKPSWEQLPTANTPGTLDSSGAGTCPAARPAAHIFASKAEAQYETPRPSNSFKRGTAGRR